jgi:hypothetical protein
MYPLISYYIHLLGIKYTTKTDVDIFIRPVFNTLILNSRSFLKIYQSEAAHSVSASVSQKSDKQIVVGSMEEGKAVNFIKSWVSSKSNGDLLIIDPYFSIEDIKVIGEAIGKDPDFEIKILTGLDRKKDLLEHSDDISDSVNIYWEENVISGPLPEIEFLFVGAQSKRDQLPIHDRWWISGNSGIRAGTSICGFGKKISEITILDSDEVASIEQMISGYLTKKQKVFEGKRVKYASETV